MKKATQKYKSGMHKEKNCPHQVMRQSKDQQEKVKNDCSDKAKPLDKKNKNENKKILKINVFTFAAYISYII